MAKLNKKTKNTTKTTNYADAPAYKMKPEVELYTRVASCLWNENKPFYGKAGDTEKEILSLSRTVDPEFVVRLAVYAREVLHLRTVPQVLLVEAANRIDQHGKPKTYVAQAGLRIMSRADEMAEVLAFQKACYKGIPNCLRTAMAARLNNMSEYEVMKYGNRGDFTMADILNLIRPLPVNKKQEALFGYIVGSKDVDFAFIPKIAAFEALKQKTEFDADAVKLAKECDATWEFLVSKFGPTKEVWNASKLPYMATLRNLRNLIDVGVDLTPYLNLLSDEEAVTKSRQLPFRFWSAFKSLGGALRFKPRLSPSSAKSKALDAIRTAFDISALNLPELPGKTVIFADSSGSMSGRISKSDITYAEIAFILSAAMHKSNPDSIVGVFGSEFKFVPISAQDTAMTNVEKIASVNVGGSTYAHLTIEALIKDKIEVDRIIVLSDMQCYSAITDWGYRHYDKEATLKAQFDKYKKNINPNAKLISVDLVGYGTSQFAQGDKSVLKLAGWSDRIIDMITLWESNDEDAVKNIKSIEL